MREPLVFARRLGESSASDAGDLQEQDKIFSPVKRVVF